ncbi:unnamed protein product [Tilletia controversa]|nr:unnamed protein product [Tilletia controversa]CAD6903623.1 unnamed protein product [Tilletia controversa]CAD6907899.1 unnamed protein product [Tilletia controversa]
MSKIQLHVVLNPASGLPGLSRTLFENQIAPLLVQHSHINVVKHETRSEGDGVRIGREVRDAIAQSFSPFPTVYTVLLGGDGTTHEFLNGLILKEEDSESSEASLIDVQLAVVPTGTANALYAGLYPPGSEGTHESSDGQGEHDWRLRSVRALLNSLKMTDANSTTAPPSALVPLTLTRTSATPVRSGDGDNEGPGSSQRTSLAHIITSHALHAAILHDSEALRAEFPGIERFKMAAQKNATVWVSGKLVLKPSSAGTLSVYDPTTDGFQTLSEDKATLEGPFLYLAALTTDRLEPTFVPGPFSVTAALSRAESSSGSTNPHPRPPSSLDIVAIRPLRSPAVSSSAASSSSPSWATSDAAQDVRLQFALGALTKITQLMYDNGKHVYLTYPASSGGSSSTEGGESKTAVQEEVLEERGSGVAVVEYFRCGGYEWQPAADDAQAKLTCIDGTVLRASKTEVEVLHDWADKVGVWR